MFAVYTAELGSPGSGSNVDTDSYSEDAEQEEDDEEQEKQLTDETREQHLTKVNQQQSIALTFGKLCGSNIEFSDSRTAVRKKSVANTVLCVYLPSSYFKLIVRSKILTR